MNKWWWWWSKRYFFRKRITLPWEIFFLFLVCVWVWLNVCLFLYNCVFISVFVTSIIFFICMSDFEVTFYPISDFSSCYIYFFHPRKIRGRQSVYYIYSFFHYIHSALENLTRVAFKRKRNKHLLPFSRLLSFF